MLYGILAVGLLGGVVYLIWTARSGAKAEVVEKSQEQTLEDIKEVNKPVSDAELVNVRKQYSRD